MSKLRFLKNPFLQEGARVFAIMAAGDVFAQTIVEKKKMSELDLKRTARFGSVGFFFIGPTLRIWYRQMDKIIAPHPKPLIRALKKMSIDQLLFAPIFTAAVITVIGKVNQEPIAQIKQRLQNDYPQILLRNYMLWPAAQIINFTFVPLNYQVIFAQFVAIIWNTYISMVLNKN